VTFCRLHERSNVWRASARERMPSCHYVMVYDAGHAIAVERPQALSTTIIDFLELRETCIVSRRDGHINP
jgi:hypothetical protein